MKHTISFPRRAAALALALLLSLPTVYAAAGEQKIQTSTQIVDGLTYRNTVTVNDGSRVESFSMELSPDSDVWPILVQGDATIYGGASIKSAVASVQDQGYHVLGAINSDFFFMSEGVPIGMVVEDGVYKSSNTGENALVIADGWASILEEPEVDMWLENEETGYTLTGLSFNKPRVDGGGPVLYNHYYSDVSTRTSTPGWYIRLRQLPDSWSGELAELEVDSELELEVVELLLSSEPLAIGRNEYILTAGGEGNRADVFTAFQVGDRVSLTTSCDDRLLSQAQWVCGVGDIMVEDGEMTDSSRWTYAKDGRQPRTALGLKRDGTMVLYAVDGRQTGYSVGLTQKNLADELLRQGCETVVNLDGGGSTSLSVWIPGQSGPAMRNKPSGGSARRCASYLMLVTDESGDGRASRLVLEEEGQVVLSGSSLSLPQVRAVDDGLNPVSADLSRLSYTSLEDLGRIRDGVYTAGPWEGTDTLELSAGRLWGTAQIHVVESLTELKVTRQGESAALNTLTVKPDEEIQLAVSGSYWGRTALWDLAPVSFKVTGDVGTADEDGLFTVSHSPGEGSIIVSAGGLTQTIKVTPTNVHWDVPEGDWAYEAVEYCYEKGIVTGVTPTLFGRDLIVSRADFMVMLHNAMGRPAPAAPCTFTDVDVNSDYYTALSWAQHVGLANGVGDGLFAPEGSLSREQAFTLFERFLPIFGTNCPSGNLDVLNQFADRDQIADFARSATATVVEQKLVLGDGLSINPKGTLTRAEMAVILQRVLEHTPVTGEPSTPDEPVSGNPDPSVDYQMALDQSKLTLASGGSATLNAVILPGVSGAKPAWSSSDPTAATVSPSGMVTNLHPGAREKTVTITAKWNGLTASCAVTCQPARRVGTVKAETGLRVRSGPDTTYSIVGALRDKEQVVVLDVLPEWYQILFRNASGQAAIGYVSADYLTIEG